MRVRLGRHIEAFIMPEHLRNALYGAGGHSVSVLDALTIAGQPPALIIDEDPAKQGRQIGGVRVVGNLSLFSKEELANYELIVAIARNEVRKQVVSRLLQLGAKLCGVRHPSAIISPMATVDPAAQILAGVIVNAGAVVRAHAVLNTGCIVDHDTSVGEFAHVGPGAVLAGAVVLEEGAFVATGAKVCPSVRIGGWSTLGAGAVALNDIPAHSVAVGVPARLTTGDARK